MTTEKVLVCPANLLDPADFACGIQTDPAVVGRYASRLFEAASFMDRPAAETDENYVQFIPYVVLKYADTVFAYRRTKKGGESRLHGNWSIGVGGHVNPEDASDDCAAWLTYARAFHRELAEETGLLFKADNCEQTLRGLLYDRSNPVGRVHLGLVHVVELMPRQVAELRCPDPALSEGVFVPVSGLDAGTLENWSGLVVDRVLAV